MTTFTGRRTKLLLFPNTTIALCLLVLLVCAASAVSGDAQSKPAPLTTPPHSQ